MRVNRFIIPVVFALSAQPALTTTIEFATVVSNTKARVILSLKDRDITGTYFQEETGEKFRIAGTLKKNRDILLLQFNSQNQLAGLFRGKLTDEGMAGHSVSGGAHTRRPFAFQGNVSDWKTGPQKDEISGQYRFGNQLHTDDPEGAVLNIQRLGSGRIEVQGKAYALLITNPETSEFREEEAEIYGTGEGKTEENVLHYREEGDCNLTVRFHEDSIDVTEWGCGGANASFNGTYERVGPPEFQR